MRKQSIKRGILIMSFSNFINKAMGALYFILLVPLITNKGMGLLNNAQYIYNLFIVAFTSGFSPALAKIISENYSKGKYSYVQQIFRTCFYLFAIAGIAAGFMMYLFSFVFTIDKDAILGIYALMPALFFTGIAIVFRAYLQGLRYMLPIALAQMTEQLTKMTVSLILIYILMPNIRLSAFGAAMGISAGAFFSLAVYAFIYLRIRKHIYQQDVWADGDKDKSASWDIVRLILRYAVPISLGGAVIQCIGLIDISLFKHVFSMIGYTLEQSNTLFGIYSAQVVKLIDIPAIFTLAISANMLPAVAAGYGLGDMTDVRRKTNYAYRLATLISIPAAVGLSVLSEPIIKLAFPLEGNTEIGGHALRILACAVIFISIIQVSNAVLQGVNRIYRPVRNIIIGLAFKVLFSGLLFILPEYGIEILSLGTVLCYMIAAVLDIADVRRLTGIDNTLFKNQLKYFIAALIMGVCVALTYNYVMYAGNSNFIATTSATLIGAVSYFIILVCIGGINKKDMEILGIGKGRRKTNE